MKRFFLLLAILALASLACSFSMDYNPPPLATSNPLRPATATPGLILPTFTPLPVPGAPTSPPATLTPNVDTPPLTIQHLNNATYHLMAQDGSSRDVTLVDGRFEEGPDNTTMNYYLVMTERAAFGDLNGDGAVDGVTALAENFGGSGVIVSIVVVLNQGGLPQHAATYYVDDRAVINGLAVQNGEILLDATVHSAADAMCCPSMQTSRSLRLWNNALVVNSFSSHMPNATNRVITIESPANGTEVPTVFSLNGNCTVAPFENNLVYKVYIAGMNDPVTQGPLNVNAPDMGAPGTFTLSLNFSGINYTGPVYISITDYSAADGSIFAQDSLFITVK